MPEICKIQLVCGRLFIEAFFSLFNEDSSYNGLKNFQGIWTLLGLPVWEGQDWTYE